MAYLTDAVDQGSKTFNSLRWGVEYCVSIMVEGNGALPRSNLSPKQCLLLPERGEQNNIFLPHSILPLTIIKYILLYSRY